MVDENNDSPKLVIPEGLYNVLKWIALILLPATASTYFGLGELFDLPAVGQVVGTLTTVSTFLGVLLNQTSKNFAKVTETVPKKNNVGTIYVSQDMDGNATNMRIEADRDPFVVTEGEKAMFDVKRDFRDLN